MTHKPLLNLPQGTPSRDPHARNPLGEDPDDIDPDQTIRIVTDPPPIPNGDVILATEAWCPEEGLSKERIAEIFDVPGGMLADLSRWPSGPERVEVPRIHGFKDGTPPEDGESYVIAPDGTWMPLEEFKQFLPTEDDK